MKKIISLLCLGSTLLLTGCGQTGPLYMPNDAGQEAPEQPAQ
ncbi:LPS translocon maturation chaperone LptM [Vibrio inusitatus]|nr:lipoprotein [Vibrio inusitatus]